MAKQANITRRLFLKSAPPALTAVGIVAAPIDAKAGNNKTPVDRFNAALAELKSAAEALDPRIYDWTVRSNGNLYCGLLISAWRKTSKYEGPGWYRAPKDTSDDDKVFVERAPQYDSKGERYLRVTTYHNGRKARAVTTELDFTTYYGSKIS